MKTQETNCPNIQFESRLNQWAEVLFDPEDLICNTNTPFGVSLIPSTHIQKHIYTSINAMTESRKDINVAKYRSILLEFDEKSIKAQLNFIKRSKIPYTSLVFSGGKSIHCVISLVTPLSSREEYDQLVDKIYNSLDPNDKWLDRTCRNPSRLTRTPTAIRINENDDEIEQNIIDLKARVAEVELKRWLLERNGLKGLGKGSGDQSSLIEFLESKEARKTGLVGRLDGVSRRAEAFLNYGYGSGWLMEAYYVTCELKRSGWTFDEVYDRIEAVDGYLDAAAETAIKNAYYKG